MHTIEISTDAELEIDEIAAWYDTKVKGLSFRFYDDLDRCIFDISHYPDAFSYYDKRNGIRKHRLNDFPYVVYFEIHPTVIHLLAVIHSASSSSFIRRRLH
jgi:hypothetical protein